MDIRKNRACSQTCIYSRSSPMLWRKSVVLIFAVPLLFIASIFYLYPFAYCSAEQPWPHLPNGLVCTLSLYPRPLVRHIRSTQYTYRRITVAGLTACGYLVADFHHRENGSRSRYVPYIINLNTLSYRQKQRKQGFRFFPYFFTDSREWK